MTYRLPAALIALALLAGCGEEPVAEPSDNDGRAAEGEVIGGTISDAMLPLDTVRSQGASALVATDTEAGEAASDAPTPAAQQAEPAAAEEPEPESDADEDAA